MIGRSFWISSFDENLLTNKKGEKKKIRNWWEKFASFWAKQRGETSTLHRFLLSNRPPSWRWRTTELHKQQVPLDLVLSATMIDAAAADHHIQSRENWAIERFVICFGEGERSGRLQPKVSAGFLLLYCRVAVRFFFLSFSSHRGLNINYPKLPKRRDFAITHVRSKRGIIYNISDKMQSNK